MPAAVDELHGGDVGLAAKAAATGGSRPYGLSPPLRGDRGPHGLSLHTLHNSDENHSFVGVPCRRGCAAGRCRLFRQQGREHPAQPDVSSATEKPVVGRATWYGPGFYGNKTASGEILQRNTLTAAHGQLPLGTKVKVTREDTNESVIVVINDRKPFKEGTIIDLAHGAADQLGIDEDGEAQVSLEVLD